MVPTGEIDWEGRRPVLVHRTVLGVQARNEVCCRSDSERLAVSTTSPEYPRKRKSSGHLATSESGRLLTLGNGAMVYWTLQFDGDHLNLRFRNTDGYAIELRGEPVN